MFLWNFFISIRKHLAPFVSILLRSEMLQKDAAACESVDQILRTNLHEKSLRIFMGVIAQIKTVNKRKGEWVAEQIYQTPTISQRCSVADLNIQTVFIHISTTYISSTSNATTINIIKRYCRIIKFHVLNLDGPQLDICNFPVSSTFSKFHCYTIFLFCFHFIYYTYKHIDYTLSEFRTCMRYMRYILERYVSLLL